MGPLERAQVHHLVQIYDLLQDSDQARVHLQMEAATKHSTVCAVKSCCLALLVNIKKIKANVF